MIYQPNCGLNRMLIEGPEPKPTDSSHREQQQAVDLNNDDDSTTSGVLLLGMIRLDTWYCLYYGRSIHSRGPVAYVVDSSADPGLIFDEVCMSRFWGYQEEYLVKIASTMK